MKKRILITGATGLIGKRIANAVFQGGLLEDEKPALILMSRNRSKAEKIFEDIPILEYGGEIIEGDIRNGIPYDGEVDYIIHAASETGSRAFVESPVETIDTAICGTKNVLEFARLHNVQSLVYLSSMEVYGSPGTDEKVTELHGTDIDTTSVRSSYPESKRMCESLCASYWSEYGVPAKIIRLTQTFGYGCPYDDRRVFAEFARNVIEGQDIILKSRGETKRCYLSVDDAVSAVLKVLYDGESCEAYNAANEATYCSIYEMAEFCAKELAGGKIAVRIEEQDTVSLGYTPVHRMNLDTSKLRALGWEPHDSLKEMYEELIRGMKEERGIS